MKSLYSTFLSTLLLTICLSASSQPAALHQDTLKLGGREEAIIKYSHLEGRNKTHVLHGEFLVEFRRHDSTGALSFTKEIWSGNHVKGLRQGRWSFDRLEHRVAIDDVNEFTMNTRLDTKVSRLRGEYDDNNPVNDWTYENNLFTNGVLQRKLSEARMQFHQGKIRGEFYYATPDRNPWLRVSGEVADNGWMNGDWIFEYTNADSIEVREVRRYDNGFLLTLVCTAIGSGDTLENIAWKDVIENLERLNQQETDGVTLSHQNFGLTFNNGYRDDHPSMVAQQTVNDRLEILLAKLTSMDTVLRTDDHMKIGTARFVHPLSAADAKTFKAISATVNSLENEVKQVKNRYTALEMNLFHSDSLSRAYYYFKALDKDMDRLVRWTNFLLSGDFSFVDPDIYIRRFKELFPDRRVVSYQFAKEKYCFEISYVSGEQWNFLGLKERVVEELQVAQRWHHLIMTKMEKIIQSDKLQAFEQKLRTEKGQVDQIFETAHPAADPTGSTIRAIYSLLGQDVYLELQREYAEAGTFGEKSALAVEMLDLTRNLKQIPTEIIDIYRRKEHIRELYTESKFDPYTFNYDFKVMKKRRLYEKVGEELFNHYINLLRHESDHTRLSSHIQRITALQDKLIELASKDTRKLERRLKSKSLPEEVHEILNLSLKE